MHSTKAKVKILVIVEVIHVNVLWHTFATVRYEIAVVLFSKSLRESVEQDLNAATCNLILLYSLRKIDPVCAQQNKGSKCQKLSENEKNLNRD